MSRRSLQNLKYNRKIFIGISLVLLFWLVFYGKIVVNDTGGDYYHHNLFTDWIINGEMKSMYPGYHLLVGVIHKITGVSIPTASVVILALATVASMLVTNLFLEELMGRSTITYVLAIVVNIVQPIFFYGYAPGYSSGNGYVSPTQALCKPFVIMSVLLFFRMYRSNDWKLKKLITLTICLIISCIIKPLFAMAFVPAMGLMLLVDKIISLKNVNQKLCVALRQYLWEISPLFVTGLFLIGQYIYGMNISIPYDTIYTEASENSKICIGFLRSWSLVVDNVWISVLLAYFSPIVLAVMLIVCRKRRIGVFDNQESNQHFIDNHYLKICFYYGVVSFTYMAFLYQDAGYETDCNFRNCWIVTYILVYIACISVLWRWVKSEIQLLRNKEDRNLLKLFMTNSFPCVICVCTLLVQCLFGLALIARNLLL